MITRPSNKSSLLASTVVAMSLCFATAFLPIFTTTTTKRRLSLGASPRSRSPRRLLRRDDEDDEHEADDDRWREPPVETRPAPPKGLGVFALGPIPRGRFVGRYRGETLTIDEQEARYPDRFPDYCLRIAPNLAVDAERSDHWSRYVNHDGVDPNLVVVVVADENGPPGARFETRRDVAAGEELCFDYGPVYFLLRGIEPAPGTESRTVRTAADVAREHDDDGEVPAPTTEEALERLLSSSSSSSSDRGKRTALWRALDYFGVVELVDDDALELDLGDAGAIAVSRSSVELEVLAGRLRELLRTLPTSDERS